MLTIEEICILFEHRGYRLYPGESVTQLEHALQTATLAEQAGASAELVCAALLHNLGRLLHPSSAFGVSDMRHCHALSFLHGLFDDAVLAPIRQNHKGSASLCFKDPNVFHDADSIFI